MAKGTRVALAGLAVIAVAVSAAATWVLLRPLSVYAWTARRTLKAAGFSRVEIATPAGRQVAFRGGSGPVLVLLHGAGDQAGAWFRVAPPLARSYTLIVPDLAGHGDSEPREGPIDVVQILDGVEMVIRELGGGRPLTIIGNSLGAWMAMLVAHRHPEWVERVVALNGGAIKGDNEHAIVLPKDLAEARAAMAQVRDAGSPRIPDYVLRDVVRHAAVGPLARFASTAPTMERWTLDGRLGEIRPPVVLVWGASDRLMPLEYAQHMLAELPSARLETLEKCGHVPQLECPEKLLAALYHALRGAS